MKASQKKALSAWNPLYWLLWLIAWLMRGVARLPYRWQLGFGRFLGRLLMKCSKKMRHTAVVNLKLCFPEKDEAEQTALLIKCFESVGMAAMESVMASWGSHKRLKKLIHLHGTIHARRLARSGQGVLLLGCHQVPLQIIGRLISEVYPFAVVYRPNKIPFIEKMNKAALERNYARAVPRHNIRTMIQALNEGLFLWFSADVDAGKKRSSVFAPFFGIQTATVTSLSKLARMSGAAVLPIKYYRRDDGTGYDMHFEAPLEHFPSGDNHADAVRINEYIERIVREKPEEYLWQYKRFKSRPNGEPRFY